MSSVDVDMRAASLAAVLDDAQRTATPITQLSATGSMGLDIAYAVQHAVIARRVGRGEHITGVKLGFTSRSKAAQMGVDDIILGTLTDAMRIDDGETFNVRSCIHPRIEPEIAYLLGTDIDPSSPPALGAIAAAAPALEIIDSRYRDFRFSLDDVIADNTSAAAYVVGAWVPVAAAGSLANRAVMLEVDGRLSQSGSTAAILGDPGRAITAACRIAAQFGFTLRAGTVLLAGSATAAVPVPRAGMVEASITGLGRVSVRVENRGSS